MVSFRCVCYYVLSGNLGNRFYSHYVWFVKIRTHRDLGYNVSVQILRLEAFDSPGDPLEGGGAMASSSSSAPICRGDLAGAVPTAEDKVFKGHRVPWSWRGRVAEELYDRKVNAADDVPHEVEARSAIERGLNAYSFEQAWVELDLESFVRESKY